MRTPVLAPLVKRYVDEVGIMLVANGQLGIEVMIRDVRQAYGRVDFLVEPIHGHGTTWVSKDRVHV